MAIIGDVFVCDVSGIVSERDKKHCICVSVSQDKYILINTEHRKIYDDFQISEKNYDFLHGTDRFVACSQILQFDSERKIQRVGTLKYKDMGIVIQKIRESKVLSKIEKDAILPDLEEWYLDNS